MANNELSGPVVAWALARWLQQLNHRRHTYRIIFVPETIGAIVYIHRHLESLKRHVAAGFVLTCVGDERAYSYVASRRGDTLADRMASHVLRHHTPDYRRYSFLERGSDERQYCSPGVDLPVVTMMRSRFRDYPEYHTSLDDLSVISPTGLGGSYELLKTCIAGLEANRTYRAALPCEPQMGRRGLYPTLSTKDRQSHVRETMNVLAYCDGSIDLLEVADRIGLSIGTCAGIAATLLRHDLLREVRS
jgi:aminopeptidase-like protein